MEGPRSNIVLIGMPGAGKSTVGVVVAKLLAMDFVDTDVLIQAREKRTLQAIIRTEGLSVLKQVEEQALLDLAVEQTVIATGGSAVYSDAAMAALKRRGIAVFLDVPLPELVERLNDLDARGVVMEPGE
ncbi:MAG: shikimate kinase, partial [Desulfuromonadales bacterium]|nr:shikimate kinase [Desulfuromonadales bacterium]